ncbi:MAG: hypothetical protein VX246_02925 [Myxococcota bacterium]|nr:hypothetical protein [Myxococcota bacterium]
MKEFGQLYAIAQIAIAIAGFAALKQRRDGLWATADADRFHGMLLHALSAAFFCILSPVIAAFTDHPERVWSICSALLGIQLLSHVTSITLLPRSAPPSSAPIWLASSGTHSSPACCSSF